MVKAESMSLMQFQKEFGTEENCANYLMYKRWKDGYRCPKCKYEAYYKITTRKLFECQQCHYQTSITAGTIMHKTKLPITTWFRAKYLVAHDKRGRSALSLSEACVENLRKARQSNCFRRTSFLSTACRHRDTDEASVYYKAVIGDFLKKLHDIIGNVKACIQGIYRGIGDKYLQSYFDEYCFRFNRRFNPNEIFDHLLYACALATPHPVH